MPQELVIPALCQTGMPLYYQQDGAPAHFTLPVRSWLEANFPNRRIGRRGPVAWSPRLLDLSPLDFLWSYAFNKNIKIFIKTKESSQFIDL